jgi:hypothetical protein
MALSRTRVLGDPEAWKRARTGVYFLITGCLLLGAGSAAWGAPTVAQMLSIKPRQEGVLYTTPTAEEQAGCTVELVKGQGKGSGWLLKDKAGNPLRRFFDSNDDNRIDVWSYYKDGVEVYREVDTTFTGKPDQYRWLNSGGSRWGVDETKDGRIKSWKVISPEEVSQEILQALVKRDLARLQALMITPAEVQTLGLPADMTRSIDEAEKAAPAKFQDTLAKLTKLGPKANWIHLETAAPQCLPADLLGSRYDVVKHPRGTILYEVNGANDWIQTGEIIQVGTAWRILGAPAAGPSTPETTGGSKDVKALDDNPKLQKLIEELTGLDKAAPPSTSTASPAVVKHHLRRADLLEKIIAEVKSDEREAWIRQVADSLSTAAQASPATDNTAMNRLLNLEKQLAAVMQGSNLAAYVTYREMQADYAARLGKGGSDYNKVQQEWLARLTKFIQDYPKAEDTPDAMLQAGMVSEFLDKAVDAKNWYGQLKKTFPDKPQAVKAAGAITRLELDGQPVKLAGPTLNDPNVAFDLDQLHGKIVIVYYWASWNSQCAGDFAKIKALLTSQAGKGVELVGINLDSSLDDARKFLQQSPAPGTHLYQTGGLDGKLATDYGIMVLPNLFLIGKDGKCVSRNVQITSLEDEIKKLQK